VVLAPLGVPPDAYAQRVREASRRVHSGEDDRERRSRNVEVGDDADLLYLAYPWWGPIMATGGGYGPNWWLVDHPYADGHFGYAIYLTPEDRRRPEAPPVQDVAVHVSAEGGWLLSDVGRAALEVRALLPYRFEVDVGAASFVERRVRADGGARWDYAVTGTAHVGWTFAQDEHWQFRSLLGVRTWSDAEGTAVGFDLRYGVEVFPVQPLIVSVDLAAGYTGATWLLRARGTLGLALGPVEVYAGWDHTVVGGVVLGGVVGGLRAWI
jgi:hypothetical protein